MAMINNLKANDVVILKTSGVRMQIESIDGFKATCKPFGSGTEKGIYPLSDLEAFDPEVLLTDDGKMIIPD